MSRSNRDSSGGIRKELSAYEYSSMPYIKTLNAVDTIDGTVPLTQGKYVIGSTTALPQGAFPVDYDATKIGSLISIGGTADYTQILSYRYGTSGFWIRTHKNATVPYAWKRIDNIAYYKKTMTELDNIDTLPTLEGSFIVNTTITPGTYPIGITLYAVMTVNGSGNYWTQTISNRDVSVTRQWVRNWYNPSLAYSPWVETTNPEVPEPVDPSQPLYGKTVLFFGDSIIQGAGGLDNIPQYVSVRTGATCINVGVGGTQMAQHVAAPDYDPFSFYALADAFTTDVWTNQDLKAPVIGKEDILALMKTIDLSTVDFIMVAYGQNDRSNEVPVGVLSDTTTDKFYGALKYGMEAIWNTYPNVQFILVTPYHRPKVYVEGELTIEPYADAIVDVAENLYYVPVIDLFRTAGINDFTKLTYLEDGLHPKIAFGYEYLGNKIGGGLLAVI